MPVAQAPSRITLSDGAQLSLTVWPAQGRPRAVILAVHGFGDFGPSTFAGAAGAWARRGITTYAYDQRGFGRNASHKQWPGPDALIGDLVAVSHMVRDRHPELPLTVVGHSMGGGVTLAAATRGLQADKLVLAAPAIAGGDALDPLRRLGGWAIAAIAPDKRFTGRGLVQITPTDNRKAWRRVTAHPRHFGEPSGRELLGLIRVMDRAAEAAPQVTRPTLTLMGERDEILAPRDVARIHARIPGGLPLIRYPMGWHWLFRDRQAPRVWADVADFALAANGAR